MQLPQKQASQAATCGQMDRRLLAGIRGRIDRGPGLQQVLQTVHLREENSSSSTPPACIQSRALPPSKISPHAPNLTLKRLDPAALSGQWSPSLVLCLLEQTPGKVRLQDGRGPRLTSGLQSSNSIFRLQQRTRGRGSAERRGRRCGRAGRSAQPARAREDLVSGPGRRPSPPRPSRLTPARPGLSPPCGSSTYTNTGTCPREAG